eukprot:1428932-Pleurochrysis_carterae.AAC.1
MSRYPIEVEEGKHSVASIPDDLFDTLAAVGHGQKMVYLCEPKHEAEIQSIWEAERACGAQVALLSEYKVASTDNEMVMAAVREDPLLPDEVRSFPAHLLVHLNALETRPGTLQYVGQDANFDALLGAHRSGLLAATPEFEEESRLAEEDMHHWERYVSVFRATYGRAQVMYDLFCGEGTMGRGAILAGAQAVGFDIAQRPSTYGLKAVSRIGGGYERKPLQQMQY